jgi:hypothetical protein
MNDYQKKDYIIIFLKKILKKILPRFLIIPLYQIENFIILSIKYGQFKSIINRSAIDRLGKPVPWYSYPAIEFLEQFDFSKNKVLEYGCGNSTIWWAKKCKSVISIEHDQKYYKYIKSLNLNNLELRLFKKKREYINQQELKNSEIIIIDGNFRKEIIENLIENREKIKKKNTIIIIDNSHWYSNIISLLERKINYTQIDFFGFCPSTNCTNATTILINKKKKFFKRSKKISCIGATYLK